MLSNPTQNFQESHHKVFQSVLVEHQNDSGDNTHWTVCLLHSFRHVFSHLAPATLSLLHFLLPLSPYFTVLPTPFQNKIHWKIICVSFFLFFQAWINIFLTNIVNNKINILYASFFSNTQYYPVLTLCSWIFLTYFLNLKWHFKHELIYDELQTLFNCNCKSLCN